MEIKLAYLTIDFTDDFAEMHRDGLRNDELFVPHRDKDKENSYSHEGWKGLTLHGLSPKALKISIGMVHH